MLTLWWGPICHGKQILLTLLHGALISNISHIDASALGTSASIFAYCWCNLKQNNDITVRRASAQEHSSRIQLRVTRDRIIIASCWCSPVESSSISISSNKHWRGNWRPAIANTRWFLWNSFQMLPLGKFPHIH